MYRVRVTEVGDRPDSEKRAIEHDVFIRRIETDKRRGMRGSGAQRVRLTGEADTAKTWATREAAERVAAQRTSWQHTYTAEEVPS